MNAYDDPAEPVELGASIFVEVNHNLVSAAKRLGLVVSSAAEGGRRVKGEPSDVLGIYDGERMLFSAPEGGWWSMAKLIYRYGPMAPWRIQKLAESTVSKFLGMYQAPVFPFASLSQAVQDTGLQPIAGVTGLQYLEANGVMGRFAQELVQASTRVNYGQNLGLIHGVETMVCMSTDGAMSVQGGNWRIFHGMVNSSDADLKLQTAVTALSRDDDSQEWTVTYKSELKGGAVKEEIYDAVVLAGPLQYAHLAIEPALEKTPDVIPYAAVHVTLFASPRRLDPAYFGLGAGQLVPQTVLTTLTKAEQADEKVMRGEGKDAVGSVGFFSVSTLRSVSRPPNDSVEFLYKVFSPEEFGDEKVKQMLGCTAGEQEGGEAITWMHRHVWNAYPYEYPRVTFEDIKLAPGLWYTAGMESFISAMETSSLMGMNVARLVVDEWEAEKKQKEGSEEKKVESNSEL